MAGCTKTIDLAAVAVGRLLEAGPDRLVCAGGLQTTRWRGVTSGGKALALASALVVGGSVQALAQDPPDPEANRVWGGCHLSQDTVNELKLDLEKGGISSGQVSFVVVYSLVNDNVGQRLSGSNFTGPVICTNPDEVGITARDKNGGPLKETTDIPTQTDQGLVPATKVNIRRAEEVFILQYDLDDGTNTGDIEERVCHTTGANVDCFRIFPAH